MGLFSRVRAVVLDFWPMTVDIVKNRMLKVLSMNWFHRNNCNVPKVSAKMRISFLRLQVLKNQQFFQSRSIF